MSYDNLKKLIRNILLESDFDFKLNDKFLPDLIEYISKFKTSEELLRSGGLPLELLDRVN